MSMYYGIQIRNAFLNHNLLEIVFALAEGSPSGKNRKAWFSDRIVTPLLSERVRLAPKQEPEGLYDFPEELKRWADEAVLDLRYARVSEWFDFPRLEQAWKSMERGVFSDPVKVWKLLSLSLQLKRLL